MLQINLLKQMGKLITHPRIKTTIIHLTNEEWKQEENKEFLTEDEK